MLTGLDRADRPRRARGVVWVLAAAVAAGLGTADAALAADAPATAPIAPPADISARDTEPLQVQPISPAAAPASSPQAEPRRPLMQLFDQFGLARPLDDLGLRIYGHVEGSYTYNLNVPDRDINAGRVFDVEHDDPTLNQITLNAERPVALSATKFDLGGRIEWLYGSDARFIHANGLFDNHDNDPTSRVAGGPNNQFDLVQAYADVNLPVGNGLRVRVGKFTYFKQIDPNASVFYSHSFTFGAALPFTLTGVYGTYRFNDQVTADFGFSRGWDQALEDNNGAIDVFGRVRYELSPRTILEAKFITGPEQDNDNANYRTAIDFTVSHQATDTLLLLFDAVYGAQAGADFNVIVPGALGGSRVKAGSGGTAQWYGISGYAIQKLTDQVSVAGRLEVFRDEEGYTTSVPQTLYEATAGLIITPFPNDRIGQNLKIRPEIRFDYSNQQFFDGFTSYSQWTAAIDAYFNF